MSPAESSTAVRVVSAVSPAELAAVRGLFVEYQQELGLDLGFQGFDEELRSLPGAYAPPSGRLLLAERGGQAAGCVGLRALDGGRCEMKRLYVRAEFQGTGLGRQLARAAIDAARDIGYRAMYLDTLPSMRAAQSLYRSLGFEDVPPYRFNPVAGVRYLALDLRRAAAR